VTFVVNACLAWAAGDLSEIHILERKRTPKRVRANAWSDAAKGESVNNSSRRIDGETRQEWTVLDTVLHLSKLHVASERGGYVVFGTCKILLQIPESGPKLNASAAHKLLQRT